MLAMAPMPTKMRVNVPTNSATQGGISFMGRYVTAELAVRQNSATENTEDTEYSEQIAPGVWMHFQIKPACRFADLHRAVVETGENFRLEHLIRSAGRGCFSFGEQQHIRSCRRKFFDVMRDQDRCRRI